MTPPDPAVKAAFEMAIAQWNAMSATTKVVIEPAPPGATNAFLQFRSTDNVNKTGGCAGYHSGSDRVYYAPEFAQRCSQRGAASGATVIAHELGHFLGLDEAGTNPNPPTIMNNPVVMNCVNGDVPTSAPVASDAAAAAGCVLTMRTTHTGQTGGGGGSYLVDLYSSGNCYSRYLVTDYYGCSEGVCQYLYSTWQYTGVVCYG